MDTILILKDKSIFLCRGYIGDNYVGKQEEHSPLEIAKEDVGKVVKNEKWDCNTKKVLQDKYPECFI